MTMKQPFTQKEHETTESKPTHDDKVFVKSWAICKKVRIIEKANSMEMRNKLAHYNQIVSHEIDPDHS